MNMKKIKEFVKEYKGEIAAGCLLVASSAACLVLCKKVAFPKFETNREEAKAAAEALTTMCQHWDYASKDADIVYTIDCDEWLENFGENRAHFNDVSMEITGAILFGNKVET